MKTFILEFLAFACIISSILVITSRNPVIAVIYLISVFINAACYLLILGIDFIGLTYLLLYVGAITILFLFVIMSINIKLTDIMEAGTQYTKNIPLAISIGIFFIYELVSILPYSILRLGDNLGANVSLLNYPIKAFKWINDQFIQSSPIYTEAQLESLFSNLDSKLFLDIDRDNLNKSEIENVVLSIEDLGTSIPSTVVLEWEDTINMNQSVKNSFKHIELSDSLLYDINNLTPVPIDLSLNEAIDGNLVNLIQLSSLGQELYTHGVSWLIICGIILLLSLLCPTLITRSPKQDDT